MTLTPIENAPAALDSPTYQRSAIAAFCCGVMALYSLYLGAIGVLLPVIGKTFHLGSAASSRLFPVNFSGFVVGVLLCGSLSDRYGRKSVLGISLALYASGLGIFGMARSFGGALCASTLIGAGSGAMETVAAALAADAYPERRAFILNAIQVAFGIGATISPFVAHTLLTAGVSWRSLYVGLAVCTLALLLILFAQRAPRAAVGAEAVNFGVLKAVLRQPFFLLVCLSNVLYVASETGFFSWMPTYLTRCVPGGAVWAGLVVTVFWFAMTVGRTATGAVLHRFPLLRLILLFAIGGAVSSALALVWQQPLLVQCFVGLTGLCFAGIFGLLLAEAGERYPEISGTAFGGVVAAGGLGGAIGPWTVGVLGETSLGWRGALLVVPIFMTLLILLTLKLMRLLASGRRIAVFANGEA